MKKKIGLLIMVGLLMAILAGCVNVESGIVINEDGSGVYTGTVAINKELMDDKSVSIEDEDLMVLGDKVPTIEKVEFEDNRGKFEGKKATFNFKDIKELKELEGFNITKLEDDVYLIEIKIDNKTKQNDEEMLLDEEETLEMFKATGAKGEFFVKVNGKVLEHNADKVENGKYSWDLINGKDDKSIRIKYKLNNKTEEGLIEVPETLRMLDVYGEELQKLGILKGTEKGLELDSELTRVQGMLMYFRILGFDESDLKGAEDIICPFTDVPKWAYNEVSYLYNKGLIKGVSETKLGSDNIMTAEQFTTLILRALNYDDNKGDFVWNKSLDKAVEINLLNNEEAEKFKISNEFSRGYMSYITYNALNMKPINQNKTLLDLRLE